MTDPRDALEALVRGKVCSVCGQQPRVVMTSEDGSYEPLFGLRCGCWPKVPKLVRPERYETKRLREMEEMAVRLKREKPEPPSVEESGLW